MRDLVEVVLVETRRGRYTEYRSRGDYGGIEDNALQADSSQIVWDEPDLVVVDVNVVPPADLHGD
jgi:hypothetical protein